MLAVLSWVALKGLMMLCVALQGGSCGVLYSAVMVGYSTQQEKVPPELLIKRKEHPRRCRLGAAVPSRHLLRSARGSEEVCNSGCKIIVR
jgi:hypothetical protein